MGHCAPSLPDRFEARRVGSWRDRIMNCNELQNTVKELLKVLKCNVITLSQLGHSQTRRTKAM